MKQLASTCNFSW